MKFVYQAFDAAGKSVSDKIEATDSNEATEALRRQGLYVTEVKPAPAGAIGYAAAAGESGSSFDQMLDRLATLTRRQMHVRNAVIGALIYPTLLVVVAMSVLATMLLFVLPRFATLFETLDVALPPTTKVLMMMSDL